MTTFGGSESWLALKVKRTTEQQSSLSSRGPETKPDRFVEVGYGASGHCHCKQCKDTIWPSELRMGWGAGVAAGEHGAPYHGIQSRWCHAACFVTLIEHQFGNPMEWYKNHLPESLEDVPGMRTLIGPDKTYVQKILRESRSGPDKLKADEPEELSVNLQLGGA